jgi:hypothetical protein
LDRNRTLTASLWLLAVAFVATSGCQAAPTPVGVDQDGNLYLAEVNNGRAQKFRPRTGANPALLVGQPIQPNR